MKTSKKYICPICMYFYLFEIKKNLGIIHYLCPNGHISFELEIPSRNIKNVLSIHFNNNNLRTHDIPIEVGHRIDDEEKS